MNDDEQDQRDAEAHQLELDRRRYEEDLIAANRRPPMDPDLFTTPLPPVRRLTLKEQFDVDMANLKALDWAMRRLFP